MEVVSPVDLMKENVMLKNKIKKLTILLKEYKKFMKEYEYYESKVEKNMEEMDTIFDNIKNIIS